MFCCCLWRKARLWAIYVFGKSAINSLAINTWKVEARGGGSRWARRGRRKRNMEDKVEFSIRKIAQSKLSTETILQRI